MVLMASVKEDNQLHLCGWCMTKDCDHCRVEVGWYGRVWQCQCPCEKDESRRYIASVDDAPPKARRKRT